MKTAGLGLIGPSARGPIVAAGMVLSAGVLIAALLATHGGELEAMFWERVLGPTIERRFGFIGGRRTTVSENGREYREYYLAAVESSGPLSRAGFQVGDVPTGYMHSASVGFLWSLDHACLHEQYASVRRTTAVGEPRIRLRLPCPTASTSSKGGPTSP